MTVKVLILSGVRHARDYIGVLRGFDEVTVVGCAEPEDAPAWAVTDSIAFADAHGVPMLSLSDGLDECDIALVCSEPARHASLAKIALDAGRHTIIDKPAAISSEECALLEKTPEGVWLSSVHRLFSPAIVRARGQIDQGIVGLPLIIDIEWLAAGGLDGTTVERPELVCDPTLSGGGEVTNFGWYPVLTLGYLTGLPVTEVFGFGGALFGGPHAAFGVEDSAVLSMRLSNEVTSTVTISRIPVGTDSSTMRIIGSHGHLFVDENSPGISLHSVGMAPVSKRTGGSSSIIALRGFFADFLEAVRTGRPPLVTWADIQHAVAVLDAARASMRTGTPIQVRSQSIV